MNVSELFDLTTWIDKHVRKPDLVSAYSNLQAALQRYAQPNQAGASFEAEKEALIESIESAPLLALTKDQLAFLESLGIAQYLGKGGKGYLEDLLYRNVIDVATSAQKIQEIVLSLQAGLQKAAQIQQGLTECVTPEDYENDGEILIRVSFTGGAALSNVTEFKEWGKIWYEIGRGIAMAHDKAPEDIRIVGATRGSIVIELAVLASIAGTTSFIIMEGLKVAEKILDLRMKSEQLREMKLKNTKLAGELEAAAEEEKQLAAERIAQEVAKKIKLTKTKDGEKIVALEKSVTHLLNFVENGGEVDFVAPDDYEEDEGEESEARSAEIQLLRTNFEEIRRLETKIALLEHPKNEES
jgi:hypothetical protein